MPPPRDPASGSTAVPGEELDPALDQARLNWALCEAILDLVSATGRCQALWDVLDRCVDLVPTMVAVLDDQREMELVVAVMQRYFPDASERDPSPEGRLP